MMAPRDSRSGETEDEAAERRSIEAAQRDPERFGDLYERNFDRVYAFTARRVRDRTEVEDIVSEVFHKALAGIGRFQWRGVPFCAWLFRIAANAIADRGQRAARLREIPRPDPPEQEDLEEIERWARLSVLVRDLPEDQRRVIALRFCEGRPIREIALALGRTEGAVKQLQLRALKSLKARLGESDG
jgi:RNA polymerase sigma-70 factor (ECF subfamily)